MTINELYSKLFQFNPSTYHRWKKQNRPIIQLIDKYFEEKDLQEFIETGKINRLEKIEENGEIKDKELEDHILFNAIEKVKNAQKFDIFKIKGFWTDGFIRAVENADEYSKKALIAELEKLDMKFWQHSNWKKITIEWIEENLSNLETKILMKYKERAIQRISRR